MKRYKAVFFDFDYTLADATDAITAGYQHAFSMMGRTPPTREEIRHVVGYMLVDGYSILSGDRHPKNMEDFRAHYLEASAPLMTEGTQLFPGCRELLCAIKNAGMQTAIISNKRRHAVEPVLVLREVDRLVDLVVGPDDVPRPKPDPAGIRFALARLGLSPEEVLFAGDTVIDAATARDGGVDFCAVLNGTTQAEAFRDLSHVFIARDLPALQEFLGL